MGVVAFFVADQISLEVSPAANRRSVISFSVVSRPLQETIPREFHSMLPFVFDDLPVGTRHVGVSCHHEIRAMIVPRKHPR